MSTKLIHPLPARALAGCIHREASGLPRSIRILPVIGLLFFAGHSLAQSPQTPVTSTAPTALKKLSLEQLMELDVTSVAKKPEPYGQAPAALQVITGDDIRRSGATSIPEALRLADNLHVAQKGSHSWAISSRGFNTDLANKLLVLIDGRSVYTPLYSGVFWEQQDYLMADIDRIEVVSGPGGTLWGANAVNGVINIITKSARDTQGLYLEGGAGNSLRAFGGARYGGMLSPNVAFRIYGKYFDRDEQVFPSGVGSQDGWWMAQGGFRIDATPSSEDSITLQGDYYSGDEGVLFGRSAIVNGNNILARWSHTFSPDSVMSLQLYYDRTHLKLPVPAGVSGATVYAAEGTLEDDLHTYDIDFQHRFRLNDRHQIVWGLGYRFTHDEVTNAPALAFLPPTLDQSLFSGFVQDEILLVSKVSLTVGTKVEHNDYTGFEFEPSLRLAWTPSERHTFWAAVSRAVRAPSRVDRDIRLPTPAFSPLFDNLLIGGSNFDSETVISYEAGVRLRLGSKATASFSVFYNEYDDLRSTSLSPPPAFGGLPLFYENNLEAQTYGLEVSAKYQLADWWRLNAGYSLLRQNVRIKSGKADFNNALNETADPQQRFSIRSSMDLSRSVEFDAALSWVDSFAFNNTGVPGEVPAYFGLDARLSWRPTENLEISLVGMNLLDNQRLEYVASGGARQEIRRSVYGKVAWQF